jgi:hypothetical protein
MVSPVRGVAYSMTSTLHLPTHARTEDKPVSPSEAAQGRDTAVRDIVIGRANQPSFPPS